MIKKIDRELYHRLGVANRKYVTVCRRLPMSAIQGVTQHRQRVYGLFSAVFQEVGHSLFDERAPKLSTADIFTSKRRKIINRALIDWRVIFNRIYPSKQKEAQAAYSRVKNLLIEMRETCKAVEKKRGGNE